MKTTHTELIRFTGTGSEYFRIWIVNLLLTLLTLTLYWPFARARKLRYFYNNTWVGEHALGFHANPWKMFRSYLLVVVLGILYWVVSNFFPFFAWLPLLVFGLFWPALWRSSLIFRMRNTSYRGLRFDFQNRLAGAYALMLPLFIPIAMGLIWVMVDGVQSLSWTVLAGAPSTGQSLAAKTAFGLSVVGVFPWVLARMYAYQFGGFVFAGQTTHCKPHQWVKPLYALWLKLAGLYLLAIVTFIFIVMLLYVALNPIWVTVLTVLYMYPIWFWVSAHYQSQLQNLLWGQVQTAQIRLHSALETSSLFKVILTNWLLIAVTLGLYWPFAAIRMAKLRLQAVSLECEGDFNEWVGHVQMQKAGALGDAAGDFFGVDMTF